MCCHREIATWKRAVELQLQRGPPKEIPEELFAALRREVQGAASVRPFSTIQSTVTLEPCCIAGT